MLNEHEILRITGTKYESKLKHFHVKSVIIIGSSSKCLFNRFQIKKFLLPIFIYLLDNCENILFNSKNKFLTNKFYYALLMRLKAYLSSFSI